MPGRLRHTEGGSASEPVARHAAEIWGGDYYKVFYK